MNRSDTVPQFSKSSTCHDGKKKQMFRVGAPHKNSTGYYTNSHTMFLADHSPKTWICLRCSWVCCCLFSAKKRKPNCPDVERNARHTIGMYALHKNLQALCSSFPFRFRLTLALGRSYQQKQRIDPSFALYPFFTQSVVTLIVRSLPLGPFGKARIHQTKGLSKVN